MSPEADTLQPATDAFLRSTPDLKYPLALVTQFPRIANRIVELKDQPDDLRAYLEDLTSDTRGGRKGFAFDVLMDIDALRDHLIKDDEGGDPEADDTIKWVS